MKIFAAFILVSLTSFSVLNAQEKDFQLDEVYSLSPTGTIKLNTDDANLYITGTDRKDVHVKVERSITTQGIEFGEKSFQIHVSEQNGDLNIDEEKEGSIGIIGYVSIKYDIWIEAPKTASLDIAGDDDDYIIKNISGEIAMNIDDGDIELINCMSKSFSFDLDDGDLHMDGGTGSLTIDADDADINIRNGDFSSVEADVDDTSLNLETSLSDNGAYNFYGDDSRFNLVVLSGGGEFEIRHDDASIRTTSLYQVRDKSESRTVYILNSGKASVKFRTDDGSIRLNTF